MPRAWGQCHLVARPGGIFLYGPALGKGSLSGPAFGESIPEWPGVGGIASLNGTALGESFLNGLESGAHISEWAGFDGKSLQATAGAQPCHSWQSSCNSRHSVSGASRYSVRSVRYQQALRRERTGPAGTPSGVCGTSRHSVGSVRDQQALRRERAGPAGTPSGACGASRHSVGRGWASSCSSAGEGGWRDCVTRVLDNARYAMRKRGPVMNRRKIPVGRRRRNQSRPRPPRRSSLSQRSAPRLSQRPLPRPLPRPSRSFQAYPRSQPRWWPRPGCS